MKKARFAPSVFRPKVPARRCVIHAAPQHARGNVGKIPKPARLSPRVQMGMTRQNEHSAVRVFLDTLRRWLDAVDRHNVIDARFQIDQIEATGRLLAMSPEFGRLFRKHHDGGDGSPDSETAFAQVHAFLTAATEAGLRNSDGARL